MLDDEKIILINRGRRNGESPRSKGEIVDPESVEYYRSLKLPELESEVAELIKTVEGGLGRVNKIMRGKLIDAVEILRERVPHGEWQEFLKAHRMNPSTVRNWRARGRGDAIRLREYWVNHRLCAGGRRERKCRKSSAMRLAMAGKRLAETVVKGDHRYAAKLAQDFLDAFDEAAARPRESVACDGPPSARGMRQSDRFGVIQDSGLRPKAPGPSGSIGFCGLKLTLRQKSPKKGEMSMTSRVIRRIHREAAPTGLNRVAGLPSRSSGCGRN